MLYSANGTARYQFNCHRFNYYPPLFSEDCPIKPLKKYKDRRNGKGSRSCLGDRTIQFLAALAIFHQDDFEEKDK